MNDYVSLHLGDCLEVLRQLPAESVDALVTDPPAGISFMGKLWDTDHGGRKGWCAAFEVIFRECLRAMKPGAHGLVWALPRTSHWTATALEDAGFEVRDCVFHHYGSGFPKSLDVSKAIDKQARGGMVRAKLIHFAEVRGISGAWLETRGVASAASFGDWTVGGHVPSDRNWEIVKQALEVTDEEEASFEREVVGRAHRKNDRDAVSLQMGRKADEYDLTAPATEAAKQWQGWGTALKPATEVWWLVRKPLDSPNVASNVLKHGTGALNVDGCRVGLTKDIPASVSKHAARLGGVYEGNRDGSWANEVGGPGSGHDPNTGRWPANLVLSHSEGCRPVGVRKVRTGTTYEPSAGEPKSTRIAGDQGPYLGRVVGYADPDGTESVPAWDCAEDCPVAELDRQSGELTSGAGSRPIPRTDRTNYRIGDTGLHYGDQGGANRFFATFAAERIGDGQRESPDGVEGSHGGSSAAIPLARESSDGVDTLPRGSGVTGEAELSGSGDTADLATFRYEPKASTAERNQGLTQSYLNRHPTVKPVELMRWLCRLITPPAGVVLDPFMGLVRPRESTGSQKASAGSVEATDLP